MYEPKPVSVLWDSWLFLQKGDILVEEILIVIMLNAFFFFSYKLKNCSCFIYLLWHLIFLQFFPLSIWSQSQFEGYLGYLTSVINSWNVLYVCIYLVPRTISHVAGFCCALFYTNTEYRDHPQFSWRSIPAEDGASTDHARWRELCKTKYSAWWAVISTAAS